MTRTAATAVFAAFVVSCSSGTASSHAASSTSRAVTSSPSSSSSTSGAGPSTTGTATATTGAAPVTNPPTTAVGAAGSGCSSPAGTVPAGVVATPIPDVDGDGRPDRAYFVPGAQSVRKLVVVTAAGGRAEADLSTASPVAATAFVANAHGGTAQILVSDHRQAALFVYAACTISVVRNVQGHQYAFDLGFSGHGTGVGCLVGASGSQLVGLNSTDLGAATVHWTRTVIDVSGTSAHNGSTSSGTFTQPADAAAIALLSTISCGDRTIDANGVKEPGD